MHRLIGILFERDRGGVLQETETELETFETRTHAEYYRDHVLTLAERLFYDEFRIEEE